MDVCSGILAATSVQIDGQVRLLTIESGKNARSVTYFHFFLTTSDYNKWQFYSGMSCESDASQHDGARNKKGQAKGEGETSFSWLVWNVLYWQAL